LSGLLEELLQLRVRLRDTRSRSRA
jgi:hypothetical protein